jgi:hypothetical protein
MAEPSVVEAVPVAEQTSTEPGSSAPSLARQVVGGGIAAAIALACVLPPLVHFVTGPLGPFIGAFVVGQRLKPDARGCVVIGAALGLTFGLLAATAAGAFAVFAGASGPPEWFPDGATVALIVGGMAAYCTALGAAGAAVGARWNA